MPVGRVLESDRESQSERQLTARRVLGGDATGGGDSLRVATNSPTSVGETTVTARGELTRLSGYDSADVSFEYRQSGAQSWTETPRQTLTSAGVFSADISGLSSNTDYEYRARAEAPDGTVDVGGVLSFTTDAVGSVSVATDSPTGLTDTGVTYNGEVTQLQGYSSVDVSFEYRQTGAASWTETSRQTVSSTGTYSETVSGLSADTEYEYRARAEAPDGTVVSGGSVVFTTQTAADTSEAQMLAQVGFDASVIERDASVSGSEAQMYDQVHRR